MDTPSPTTKKKRWLTRRSFLRGLATTAVTGAGGAGYMRWIEADWLVTTHTRVTLPRRGSTPGTAPLRVLHLSDLHADSRWVPLDHIARAVALGLAQKPDMICLTGDFITSHYGPLNVSFPDYAAVLRPLAAAAPTFACLGNHDGGIWTRIDGGDRNAESVRNLLRVAGIDLVHNTVRETTVRGRRVQIFGVGDWWAGDCVASAAFRRAPDRGDAIRLVLNHNPDAKTSFTRYDWDLMLCGHTHGGQIGLPFLGRLVAPVVDKRFIAGLYPWEGRQIFITRGVGNLHRARLFCRPEISVLEVG